MFKVPSVLTLKNLHDASIAFKCSEWTFNLPEINRLVPVEVRRRVFTAQHALSPYIKHTHFVFKGLTILRYNKLLFVIYLALDSYRKVMGA